MSSERQQSGYELDELEELVIPPVAEIDVVAPSVPVVIASVVFVVVLS